MSKVIIIHPQDRTTSFLKPIIGHFKEFNNVTVLEPGRDYDANRVQKDLEEIYTDEDIIIFLGHGRSDALYGAQDDVGEKIVLLSKAQIEEILADKKVILFSCLSSKLLTRVNDRVKRFVGFGNMPTDWKEISAHREFDHTYLSNLTNKSLVMYKEILVSMIQSLAKILLKSSNFSREAYLSLRMDLNLAMLKVARNKDLPLDERIELFRIIQGTKQDMIYQD